MSNSCVICGGEENEGELLVQAPCGNHWVCPDDIASFFERATNNESLFPPKCCGQMFMLGEYEEYIPFETSWAYQMKEQGEYAILAKYRVYCANNKCNMFLHPTSHVPDPDTNITYAICEDESCGNLTCCSCKKLLTHGTQNHICQQTEDEKQFKEIATKKGYQECAVCGATVELAEACNHITCECGHEFCYICGEQWPGLHQCPHYGPAEYDDEGYNQDGFHRDTGLNREGLTRQQDLRRARGEEDDDEDDEAEDPDWEVLQHIDPAEREVINLLPAEEREDALDNLRIMLHTTQGIIFNQGQAQAQAQPADEDEDEEQPDEVIEGVDPEQNAEDAGDHGEDQENANNEDDDNHVVHIENIHQRANDEFVPPITLFYHTLEDEPFPTASNVSTARPNVQQQLPDNFDDAFSPTGPHHRGTHGANNEMGLEEGSGRTSSSSDSGDILPATPLGRILPTGEAKGIDEMEQSVTIRPPPGAWVDDDHV